MSMPFFSVIVCTYNGAARLPASVGSVLEQSFTDFELIVVNDGSTDDTSAVAKSFSDSRVREAYQANGGLSSARNLGLREAHGTFVVYLDDDDVAASEWLSSLAAIASEHVGVVSCGCRFLGPDGVVQEQRLPAPHPAFPDTRGVFLAGTFAVRTQIYRSVGGYSVSCPTNQQTEVMLRVLPETRRRGLAVAAVDTALVDIERREDAARSWSQRDHLEGAEYLIDQHGEALVGAPHVLANYHAVAGVAAIRLGFVQRGRGHLRRACRLARFRPRHVARSVAAHMPIVGTRFWTRGAQ